MLLSPMPLLLLLLLALLLLLQTTLLLYKFLLLLHGLELVLELRNTQASSQHEDNTLTNTFEMTMAYVSFLSFYFPIL